MGSGIFFWLILICAAPGLLAFNCTECDKSKCPPKSISCPGRAATDPCGCCRQCAKQEWEPCGGENWELGYCDLRYRCAAVNGTGNVEIPDIGVCKYEGLTGDYWMDDDMNCPPVYGCKIRMSTCECTTIRTCVDYFTFSDDNSCLKHRRGMDYDPPCVDPRPVAYQLDGTLASLPAWYLGVDQRLEEDTVGTPLEGTIHHHPVYPNCSKGSRNRFLDPPQQSQARS